MIIKTNKQGLEKINTLVDNMLRSHGIKAINYCTEILNNIELDDKLDKDKPEKNKK